jgi:adenylate cyclase
LRYLFEDYALDTDRRELRRGADLVALAPQVFDLLQYLIQNRERVVSKDNLITGVWDGRIVSESALTTRINAARSAIGDSGDKQRLIKTVPRKGIRFVATVREEQRPAAAAVAESMAKPALALPDKPSIAVLPFANLSSDQEQEYLADGIVDDIVTELSRFSELFVIARNSSFQYKGKAVDLRQVASDLGVRYVLEGSVRRGGDRIRIGAQLIDAATGALRWAERYDRALEGIFAIQDEVVRTIVAILAAHVRKAETDRTRAKPPNSWQAYDYYLQAAEAFAYFRSSAKTEKLYETRHLVQRSLAIDPSYARSYALLASTHPASYWLYISGSESLADDLDQAYQLANKAVQLDANLPEAHASLGIVLVYKRHHKASIIAFERAVRLNPNYVDWRFGFALVLAGNSRRAINVLQTYMRLDPFYSPYALANLGLAHYMLKQYTRTLPALQDCVSRVSSLREAHGGLAAAYAQLGRMEEAQAAAAEVLRLQPNYTISGISRRIFAFKDPKDAKHFFDGLRKAGLPE